VGHWVFGNLRGVSMDNAYFKQMGFYGLFFLQKGCNPFLAASGEAQEIDQG
jgi:hypothetical protein